MRPGDGTCTLDGLPDIVELSCSTAPDARESIITSPIRLLFCFAVCTSDFLSGTILTALFDFPFNGNTMDSGALFSVITTCSIADF